MVGLFAEFLSFLEIEATSWEDAAKSCERWVDKLPPDEAAELKLRCAAYRERVTLLRNRASTMRQQGLSSYREVKE